MDEQGANNEWINVRWIQVFIVILSVLTSNVYWLKFGQYFTTELVIQISD